MAGMAVTVALNATTNLDVAIEGCAPSRTSEQSVQRMADGVGVSLGRDERRTGERHCPSELVVVVRESQVSLYQVGEEVSILEW